MSVEVCVKKNSIKASNMQPVIGHVIAEVPKESLKNNSHLFTFARYLSALVAVMLLLLLLLLCLYYFAVVFSPCVPLPYHAGSEIKKELD